MADINYENLDCSYSIRLIDKLKSLDTKNVLDFNLINKAIYWAKKYHGDQKRKSGEPYYSHPLEVAYMVSEYKLKTDVIVASILHDIVEDTEVTVEMIQGTFGERIAEMVDRLTRDRPDGTKLSVEQVLNNAYQLKDKEVLIIKLFDRLHNIQTIGSMNIEKMEKITNETLINFVLLSEYLELTSTGKKVQELCLEVCKCLNPEKIPYINIFSFNDNYQPLSLIYQND
ncbi:MAG: bifunctional (p)ppGpp synthetase/guanosine-3',5'-bis(diphosphate) 3'-pyrophosphohydrolase [Alphaproteobacteria bacterium]|nr:bifunctional (p)ppGpp synthetase/guanosine-3',5'-bis(diphosphate) 3'-pyrophosphohydrolase [Alphaproteobacteria bacterium]